MAALAAMEIAPSRLLPIIGLRVAGYAFLACYAMTFAVNVAVTRYVMGFRCQKSNLALVVALFAACVVTMAFAKLEARFGLIAGAVLLLAYGTFAAMRLVHLARMHEAMPAWSHRFIERLSRIAGTHGD